MKRRGSKRKAMQAAAEKFRSQSSDEQPAIERAAIERAAIEREPDHPVEHSLGQDSQGLAPVTEVGCPHCAERIKAAAKICKHCGLPVRGKPAKEAKRALGSGRAAAVRSPSSRVVHHHGATTNPGTAALIAVFIPGGGHIYAGRVGLGLVYLFFGWPAFAASMVLGTGLALSTGAGTGSAEGALTGLGVGAVLWLALVAVYFWQVFDAYNSCKPAPQLRGRRR